MIYLTPNKLSNNEPTPYFPGQLTTLTNDSREIQGIYPDESVAIPFENYSDFGGAGDIGNWLKGSLAASSAALEKKIGYHPVIADIHANELNVSAAKFHSSAILNSATVRTITANVINQARNFEMDIDEADFNAKTSTSLSLKRINKNETLTKIKTKGASTLNLVGMRNEILRETEKARIDYDLTSGIVKDDYATRAKTISDKAEFDVLTESNFNRPNLISMANKESRVKIALSEVDIYGAYAESAIKVASINASSANDINAINSALAIEVNNTALSAQKESVNINLQGGVESTYILRQAGVDVSGKGAITSAHIASDSSEAAVQMQSDTANANLKISSMLALANAKTSEALKLAQANVIGNQELLNARIIGDATLTIAQLISDRKIALLENLKDETISKIEILNDSLIADSEIKADSQKTQAEIFGDSTINAIEISSLMKSTEEKILNENLLVNASIQNDSILSQAQLTASKQLSLEKITAISTKNAAVIANNYKNAALRISEIASSNADAISLIKTTTKDDAKQQIQLASQTAASVLANAKQMISLTTKQNKILDGITSGAQMYSDLAAKVKAAAHKARKITVFSEGDPASAPVPATITANMDALTAPFDAVMAETIAANTVVNGNGFG